MKYTIKNFATGQTTKAKTYRNAQRAAARMIASDVEGQEVMISDGQGNLWLCRNAGLSIRYTQILADGNPVAVAA